jgi:hypothetical protein
MACHVRLFFVGAHGDAPVSAERNQRDSGRPRGRRVQNDKHTISAAVVGLLTGNGAIATRESHNGELKFYFRRPPAASGSVYRLSFIAYRFRLCHHPLPAPDNLCHIHHI